MILELDLKWITNIIFFGICALVVVPFMYREHLYRVMKGKLLCEFRDARGIWHYIPCPIVEEILVPRDGTVTDEKGEDIIGMIKTSPKDKKIIPGLKDDYFVRRDFVDSAQYPNKPIMGFLSIQAKCTSFFVGDVEPIGYTKAHMANPVTRSQVFVDKVREYDILGVMQAKGEAETEFWAEQDKKRSTMQKGGKSNKSTTILLIVGGIALVGILVYIVLQMTKFGQVLG